MELFRRHDGTLLLVRDSHVVQNRNCVDRPPMLVTGLMKGHTLNAKTQSRSSSRTTLAGVHCSAH